MQSCHTLRCHVCNRQISGAATSVEDLDVADSEVSPGRILINLEGINALTAINSGRARGSRHIDDIITSVTLQRIGTLVIHQGVIACTTTQAVVSGSAYNFLIALTAGYHIITSLRVDVA